MAKPRSGQNESRHEVTAGDFALEIAYYEVRARGTAFGRPEDQSDHLSPGCVQRDRHAPPVLRAGEPTRAAGREVESKKASLEVQSVPAVEDCGAVVRQERPREDWMLGRKSPWERRAALEERYFRA